MDPVSKNDDEHEKRKPEPVCKKADKHEKFELDHSQFIWAAQTVRTHAVQCSKCGKYRMIPDETHYETIREQIHEQPWFCEDAFQWNSLASCDLPDEVTDSKFVLTTDRPGIPATPAGWERAVHIRAGPNNRQFSDVFYFAPPGLLSLTERRMRSYQDIKRTVKKYPALLPDDVNIMKQFSFATPAHPGKHEASFRTHGESRNEFQFQLRGKGRQTRSGVHCCDSHNTPTLTERAIDKQNEKLVQSQGPSS